MGIDAALAWKSLSLPFTNKQASSFLARIESDFNPDRDKLSKADDTKDVAGAFADFVTAARVDLLSPTAATAKLVYNFGRIMLERLDPFIDPDAIAFVNYHVLFAAINYAHDKPQDEPDLVDVAIKAGEEALNSGRLPPLKRRTALITLVLMADVPCHVDLPDVAAIRRLIAIAERADREGQFNPKVQADRYPSITIARCLAAGHHKLAAVTNDIEAMKAAIPYFERYLKAASKQDDAVHLIQAHLALGDAMRFLATEPGDQVITLLTTAHDHLLKAADIARSQQSGPAALAMDAIRKNTYAVFRALAAATANDHSDLPPLWQDASPPISISAIVEVFATHLPPDDEAQDVSNPVQATV